MRRPRRNVLFSLLASFMLLVASTAFVAHQHQDEAAGGSGAQHCDLCLQFSSADGPSAAPAAPTRVDALLEFLSFANICRTSDSRREGGHRSRAPPLLELPL